MEKNEEENSLNNSGILLGSDKDQSKSQKQQQCINNQNLKSQAKNPSYDDQDYVIPGEKFDLDFNANEEKKHLTLIQCQIDYVKTMGGKQNYQINQQQLLLYKNICLLKQKRSKMNQKKPQQIDNNSYTINQQEINQYKKSIENNDQIISVKNKAQKSIVPTYQKTFLQKFLEQQQIINFLPKILQRSIY